MFVSKRLNNVFHFLTLGWLANGILHDLVNPLTAILLSLNIKNVGNDIGNDVEKTSKELSDFINIIQRQLKNNHIREKFLISESIKESCILMKHKAMLNNVIIFNFIENDRCLFGNKTAITRILMNLISNAIDSYEKCPRENQVVHVSVFEKDKNLNISVKDFGCGIPEKDKNKIFRLMYTDKNNGTGIGLYFSKINLRKEFMGKIKIETRLNKGSNFIIQIPLKTTVLAS